MVLSDIYKGDNMARVLVSMSTEFLDKVDSLANAEQRTRSEFIREALRLYMRRNRQTNPIKAKNTAAKLEDLLS